MRVITFLLLIGLIGCNNEIEIPLPFPIVVTEEVTKLTAQSVEFSARLMETNATEEIIDYGFVLSPYPNPTLSRNSASNKGNPGKSFSSSVNQKNLAHARYVVRAYVRTKTRIIYANSVTFIGNEIPGSIAI